MARNGNGIYSLPSGNPVVAGTTIDVAWANPTMSDIAAALTGSLPVDGQAPMTGVLRLVSGTANAPAISFNAETVTGLWRPAANQLAFSVGGQERARFASDKFLIGSTTDTGEKLQVTGTAKITGATTLEGTLTVSSGGASITGTLTVSGVVSGATPTDSGHLTTKLYVDTGRLLTSEVNSSSSVTAVAFVHYLLTNNSSQTTITLPASPTTGDEIWITNASNRTDMKIARNGYLIAGLEEDMFIDKIGVIVKLRFFTAGWRFV